MLEFKLNVPERKTLVRRMEELTGIHPYYTRTPRCAFEIGAYTAERDGRLVVEEAAADRGLLRQLMDEGLILDESGWIGTEETVTEEAMAVESAAEEAVAAETEADETVSEEAEAEEAETEETVTVVAAAEETETDEPDGLEISLPIGDHTGTSLRNLVNLIYSRGSLINKALGTQFSVSEALAEKLKDDTCTYTVMNFLQALRDFKAGHNESGIRGLKLTMDKVTFTGFRLTDDTEYNLACTQLCELMNRQAVTQKRIQLRPVDDTNEKYAMRIWLVRIGMGGEEYKTARRVLLGNLGGNGAFRTPADAERAKERLKAKKDREKAQEAEAAGMAEGSADAGTEAENAAAPAAAEPDTAAS